MPPTKPTLARVDFDHADAAMLRGAQSAELRERYGTDDNEPGVKPTASDTPVFFVAYVEGQPVGCGGLRPLPVDVLGENVAELKRMFVQRASRGTGVATALLHAIEDEATRLGIRRLVLETGARQPDAMRFYEREGYRPIPPFGAYVDDPLSRCFERVGAARPTR